MNSKILYGNSRMDIEKSPFGKGGYRGIFKRYNLHIYIIILLFSISSISCATLQKKFIRKNKKEIEKAAPIITTYDYSKDLRIEELYKKYFLFWKSWQGELIDNINTGYKKRKTCYDYTLMSLLEMQKYLTGEKLEELKNLIEKIKSIESSINKDRLSESEGHRIRRLLEKTRQEIDKGFSYSSVKELLKYAN